MGQKLEYRPDIDGLRTIAVLPVVLFHFGFTAFSGGFVGVDVFFVISGYLITRLILHEVEQGSFSFARFYERRARRLFPAMFVTVVASLVVGQFLLFPEYLSQAAGSAIFAVTSLSNVFFWTQSGYFDTEAVTKPLLHTWSLSVEEQFYLLWPVVLVTLAVRVSRSALLGILALAGVISLLGAEYVMRSDISAAFYLTPFRIVEFVIGAGVLWAERFIAQRRLLLEACLLAGLLLIAYAVFSYSEATAFPGFAALVPCFGAAFAIAGGRAPLLGLLLRNRVSVSVGLISYSIYLVHWPLAVYFDAYFFREPSVVDQFALLGLTLVIAALMYRFVETPFRRPQRRRLSAPGFGLACALLALLLVLPASTQWSSRQASADFAAITRTILSIPLGILGATPAYAQAGSVISKGKLEAVKTDRSQLLRGRQCKTSGELCGSVDFGKTNVLIIGDSHAEDAFNMLVTAFPENNYILMRAQGCAPFQEDWRKQNCQESLEIQKNEFLGLYGIDYIYLHMRIVPKRVPLLADYVAHLTAEGFKVIVSGVGPSYTRAAPDIYRRLASAHDPFPDMGEFRNESIYEYDQAIRTATQAVGAVFFDRYAFICPGGKCRDYTLDNAQLLVADEHHMTWEAAVELGLYLRKTHPYIFER